MKNDPRMIGLTDVGVGTRGGADRVLFDANVFIRPGMSFDATVSVIFHEVDGHALGAIENFARENSPGDADDSDKEKNAYAVERRDDIEAGIGYIYGQIHYHDEGQSPFAGKFALATREEQ